MPLTQDDVLSALKQCYDPEIPVNIVDLGLIYEVRFDALPDNQQDVTVEMTLTAQGCPEHVNISAQVKSRVEQLPGVRNANVNVVWNPPWTPERLSPDARSDAPLAGLDGSQPQRTAWSRARWTIPWTRRMVAGASGPPPAPPSARSLA